MENVNQLSQYLSTGNKLVDVLGGGLYGFNANNQRKGYYLPTFNYMGNGLARSGLQYYSDPNYVNPYDAAQATSSVLNNQKFGNFIDSLKQRFQKDNNPMFQLDTIYKYPLKTQEYKMPQLGNMGGNVIGGTQGAYDNMYNLPTQQLNFNKFWE